MIMVQSYVWDTGAIMQFFADNEEAVQLMRKIKQKDDQLIVPQIILSELYYKTWQKFGEHAALLRAKNIRESMNVYILNETDTYVTGKLKVDYSFLSLADAIVAATATATGSRVVSTDTDFSKVKTISSIKIDF